MNIIEFHKKVNWGIVIYIILCELVISAIGATLFYGLIQESFSYNIDLWIVFLVLILLWIKLLDVILWNLRGVEVVQFRDTSIVIEKRRKIFRLKKTIAYNIINSIELEKPCKDIWLNMFSNYEFINYGAIKISCKQGKYAYRVGQSLTPKEAKEMMLQIKFYMPPSVRFNESIKESVNDNKLLGTGKKNGFLRFSLFLCALLTGLQVFLLLYYLLTSDRGIPPIVFFMGKIILLPALFLWGSCIVICLKKDNKPNRIIPVVIGSFLYAPYYYWVMIKNKYI